MNNLEGFLIQLIASAGISTLLAAALVWLTKSFISERLKNAIASEYAGKLEVHKSNLAGQLETLKAQLQTEAGLEIERAKSSLALTAKKQELQFSRMHEKRAEAIALTFDDLSSLYTAMTNYTQMFEYNGIASRDERRNVAAISYNKFHDHFVSNRIFLPKDTADKVAQVDEQIRVLFNQFAIGVDRPNTQGRDVTEQWIKISNQLDTDIRQALTDIEDDFRNLIGGTES